MLDELWALEEEFWTGGEKHFRRALAPDCVMAFPAPVGILAGEAIVESLRHAPRWSSIAMRERHTAQPSPDLAVLAYLAEAKRGEAAPYRGYCTSTYRRTPKGWRLVQHQQTPVTVAEEA
ncbi:MAG TPA: nuclear transport factor 2 family protein [Afifellaceae bacterium]|nr:nuclear transport factor 2 family protein [Afifellaceae bacterium]